MEMTYSEHLEHQELRLMIDSYVSLHWLLFDLRVISLNLLNIDHEHTMNFAKKHRPATS